jgi:hypothetical protein
MLVLFKRLPSITLSASRSSSSGRLRNANIHS